MGKILITITVIFLPFLAIGQDKHYSQFYTSPLTVDPSLTGNNDQDIRAGINQRSQWRSISPEPFLTTSVFFDIKFMNGVYPGDKLAGGIVLLNDAAGNAGLKNQSVMLSIAYHLAMGESHTLSLGVQGGLTQRKLDFSSLYFQSQYQGNQFNTNMSSGENLLNEKFTYGDFSIGSSYRGKLNERFILQSGLAIFHITNPKESFYKDITDEIPRLNPKKVFETEVDYRLSGKVNLLPGLLYMNQTEAQELTFGTLIGYQLPYKSTGLTLYAGTHYRWKDAVILTVAGRSNNYRLGLSYDINTSDLTAATGGKGGFEISLMYFGYLKKSLSRFTMPCIRF